MIPEGGAKMTILDRVLVPTGRIVVYDFGFLTVLVDGGWNRVCL